jgi:hypothetical protein
MGSILELFPPRPQLLVTDPAAALAADWQVVGDDLRAVMGDLELVLARAGQRSEYTGT